MDPTPIVEPRPERNAIEVFLLLLALQSAVVATFVAPEPLSVAVLLGPVWSLAWAVGLFAGATITLAGLFWPGRPGTAVLLQQLGYGAFAPMSLARGVALLGIGQHAEAVVVLAFAAAATARLLQLEHRLGRRWWLPCRRRRQQDVEP